jgi:membrane protein DedA with SNARE-associated domain
VIAFVEDSIHVFVLFFKYLQECVSACAFIPKELFLAFIGLSSWLISHFQPYYYSLQEL